MNIIKMIYGALSVNALCKIKPIIERSNMRKSDRRVTEQLLYDYIDYDTKGGITNMSISDYITHATDSHDPRWHDRLLSMSRADPDLSANEKCAYKALIMRLKEHE